MGIARCFVINKEELLSIFLFPPYKTANHFVAFQSERSEGEAETKFRLEKVQEKLSLLKIKL